MKAVRLCRAPLLWAAFLCLNMVLAGCKIREVPAPAAAPLSPPELTLDQRVKLVRNQPVVASPSIFDGNAFPKIDFLNKDLVAALTGPYTVDIRFFDGSWNEVGTPTAPGRYGAWIEIRFVDGIVEHRHLTLFKTPHPYVPAKDPYRLALRYPAAFGLSVGLSKQERWDTEESVGDFLDDAARRGDDGAVLVAALHDFEADPKQWRGFNSWYIEDDWWETLEDRLGVSKEYPRLVRLPDGYDQKPDAKWPLLLFLHGAGERGDNLDKIKDQGPLGYLNKGNELPFIVVAPQCPQGEWWLPRRLSRLLDDVEKNYRIDPRRIYVTGLSAGGDGTFDLAATYPERFAAIASLSGEENPAIAERLKNMPTWIFHGTEDTVVPTRHSVAIAEALKQLGAPVKLTLYPGVGHGGWAVTYADPALYAWFLQHSR